MGRQYQLSANPVPFADVGIEYFDGHRLVLSNLKGDVNSIISRFASTSDCPSRDNWVTAGLGRRASQPMKLISNKGCHMIEVIKELSNEVRVLT